MSLPHRGPAPFASRELLVELLAIQAEKRSCVVVVRADGTSVSLHFEEGKLVHAEDGTTAKALGRLLVEEGKISEEDLTGLLDALTLADARGRNVRLGDLAVARSLITRKELSLALFSQVRRKVVAAIGWDNPELEVSPLPPRDPSRERARFPTPLEPVILSAFRRLASRTIASRIAPYGHGKVSLEGEHDAVVALFRPKAEERATLAKVLDDPAGTLIDDLASGALPDEGLAFVATLLVTGHLVRIGGPVSQRKKPPLPPSTVVRGAARPRLLRTAKLQMLAPIVRARGDGEGEGARDGEAGAPTRDVPARDPVPGSPAAKLRGERAFLDGRAHMAKGREALAKAELWRAHRLVPNATEYELYLAWLTLRGDDKRAAELESLALRAKRQDPELGFASYVLSHLALLRGDVENAEAEQQRALRLGVRGSMHEGLREPAGSSAVFAAMRPTVSPRKGRALPYRPRKAPPSKASEARAPSSEALPKPAASAFPDEQSRATPLVSVPGVIDAPPPSLSEIDEGGWDDVLPPPSVTKVAAEPAPVPESVASPASVDAHGSGEKAGAPPSNNEPRASASASATMRAASELATPPASAKPPISGERPSTPSSSRIPRPTPSTRMKAAEAALALAASTPPASADGDTTKPSPATQEARSEQDSTTSVAAEDATRGDSTKGEPTAEPSASASATSEKDDTSAAKVSATSNANANATTDTSPTSEDPAPRSAPASDDDAPSSEAVPASEALPALPEASRAPLYLGVLGVLAVVAVGIAMYLRSPDERPTPPAPAASTSAPTTAVAPPALSLVPLDAVEASVADAAPAQAALASDAAPGPDAAPQDASSPTDAATAETSATPDAAARENGMGITGWKTGDIVPDGAPRGHRIFVDGHAVGETPATVSAPCGMHQVQIGSKGTLRKVEIPCGGSVSVKP